MLVLAAANSAAPAGKGDGNVVIAGAEGARLDAAVTTAQPEFWGAVLVSRGDEIVLSKGYGASGADARPHTPATLFGIASASKQFTATAIVHLAQRGKLSLDDTLDRFWKKLPTDKHAVTLRHLLTHTSGLASGGLGSAVSPRIQRETLANLCAAAWVHAARLPARQSLEL